MKTKIRQRVRPKGRGLTLTLPARRGFLQPCSFHRGHWPLRIMTSEERKQKYTSSALSPDRCEMGRGHLERQNFHQQAHIYISFRSQLGTCGRSEFSIFSHTRSFLYTDFQQFFRIRPAYSFQIFLTQDLLFFDLLDKIHPCLIATKRVVHTI